MNPLISASERFRNKRVVWDDAVETQVPDSWAKYTADFAECDLFPFVADHGHLADDDGGQITLATWLNRMLVLEDRELTHIAYDATVDMVHRLPVVTFRSWKDRIRGLLQRGRDGLSLPRRGAFVYYTDLLQCAVVCEYAFEGSAVEIVSGFAFPQPHAYLDPMQAISHVQNRSQLRALKAALSSHVRVVVQRNTITAVHRDQHPDVFGPTIDTLFLNDWLNSPLYMRSDADSGAERFLEVGSGNGLLAASFANTITAESIDCVDIDSQAIACTSMNLGITKLRGPTTTRYLSIGEFSPTRYTNRMQLIVSNPPYVPVHHESDHDGRGARATHGTDLLQELVTSTRSILDAEGAMYLVISTMAEQELLAAAASHTRIELVGDRRVPFDIDGADAAHVQWLIDDRGLVRDDSGTHWHRIAVYCLRAQKEEE